MAPPSVGSGGIEVRRLKRLYHGTLYKNLESIMRRGLEPRDPIFKAVFTSCSEQEAGAFAVLRKSTEFLYDGNGKLKTVTIEGHEFPDIVQHTEFVVLEIDGTKLDWSQAFYGSDHNASWFTAQVLCFPQVIPPSAILRARAFSTAKAEEEQ